MDPGRASDEEATDWGFSWALALPVFDGEGAGEMRLSMRESVEVECLWLWTRDADDCRAITLFVEGITALPVSVWGWEVSMTGMGSSCGSGSEEILGRSDEELLKLSGTSAILVRFVG